MARYALSEEHKHSNWIKVVKRIDNKIGGTKNDYGKIVPLLFTLITKLLVFVRTSQKIDKQVSARLHVQNKAFLNYLLLSLS